jgi:hypothetical protein
MNRQAGKKKRSSSSLATLETSERIPPLRGAFCFYRVFRAALTFIEME